MQTNRFDADIEFLQQHQSKFTRWMIPLLVALDSNLSLGQETAEILQADISVPDLKLTETYHFPNDIFVFCEPFNFFNLLRRAKIRGFKDWRIIVHAFFPFSCAHPFRYISIEITYLLNKLLAKALKFDKTELVYPRISPMVLCNRVRVSSSTAPEIKLNFGGPLTSTQIVGRLLQRWSLVFDNCWPTFNNNNYQSTLLLTYCFVECRVPLPIVEINVSFTLKNLENSVDVDIEFSGRTAVPLLSSAGCTLYALPRDYTGQTSKDVRKYIRQAYKWFLDQNASTGCLRTSPLSYFSAHPKIDVTTSLLSLEGLRVYMLRVH